MFLNKY